MLKVTLFLIVFSQTTTGHPSDNELYGPGYSNSTLHDSQYHSGSDRSALNGSDQGTFNESNRGTHSDFKESNQGTHSAFNESDQGTHSAFNESDQGTHSAFNGSGPEGNETLIILPIIKILNVTCPELDTTFYNSPPFNHLELPHCGDVIKPSLTLYGPSSHCVVDPAYLPNNVTNKCINDIIHSGNIKNVAIIIHGFLKSFSSPWMHDMSDYLISNEESTAVLVVGWGHGSGGLPVPDPLYYYKAAANTRYMGVMLKKVLVSMVELGMTMTNRLDRGPSFHCIGHSLGAHICSFAGKALASDDAAFFSLRRLSGLDPAGPLFADDVPYPFNMKIKPSARLHPSDADLVDVIHTDGKARFPWMIVPQYGTMMKLGHIDFYPGNDEEFGWNQPGCWEVMDIGACSHSRAHDLFLSSMTSPCEASMKCKNTLHIPESCQNITTGKAPIMGYWLNFTKDMMEEGGSPLEIIENLEEDVKPLERLEYLETDVEVLEQKEKLTNKEDKSDTRTIETQRTLALDSGVNVTGKKANETKRTEPEKFKRNNTKNFRQRSMARNQGNTKRKEHQKNEFKRMFNGSQNQNKSMDMWHRNDTRGNTYLYTPVDQVKLLSKPAKEVKMLRTYNLHNQVKLSKNVGLLQRKKKTSEKHLYIVVEDIKKAPFCNKIY